MRLLWFSKTNSPSTRNYETVYLSMSLVSTWVTSAANKLEWIRTRIFGHIQNLSQDAKEKNQVKNSGLAIDIFDASSHQGKCIHPFRGYVDAIHLVSKSRTWFHETQQPPHWPTESNPRHDKKFPSRRTGQDWFTAWKPWSSDLLPWNSSEKKMYYSESENFENLRTNTDCVKAYQVSADKCTSAASARAAVVYCWSKQNVRIWNDSPYPVLTTWLINPW